MPKSNIAICWTPIFEWYVVQCGSKHGLPKLHVIKRDLTNAQHTLTNLSSIEDKIGGQGEGTCMNT